MGQLLNIKGKKIGEGRPLVCVPIMVSDSKQIIKEAATLVAQGAEMIEWRVDAFSEASSMNSIRCVLEGLEPITKDTILVYTYRSKAQGGLGEHPAEMIRDIHQVAAETKVPDFIDVEYFAEEKAEKEIRSLQKQGCHVIASHHDFEETPERKVIRMLLELMRNSGASIVKLAVMPQIMKDVLHLLEETNRFHTENPNVPVITMSMGALGTISRVAGEYVGSCVTFGAGEQASAPGQLPKNELLSILESLHNCLSAQ